MHNVVCANVAGLNIKFTGFKDSGHLWDDWADFIVSERLQTPDLLFSFRQTDSISLIDSSSFTVGSLLFQVTQNETFFCFSNDKSSHKVTVVAGNNWDQATVECNSAVHFLHFLFFTDIVYRTRLADFSGFTAHASVIEYNGGAVMFSAKSGVGKSTHADLWSEHLAARIINGDHAIIRMIEGTPVIFGAPWSGTSPYKKKDSAPLKAIVLLEQNDSNEISLLEPHQALQGLLPHCYLPYWNKSSIEKTLGTIDSVLNLIPVFRLKCLPNKQAAELVKKTIFGSSI